MELYFNELSIEGKDSVDEGIVRNLAEVYRELLKYDVKTCRIASADNHKLHQMIRDIPNSQNIKNFYFSFFRSPYESETVENEQDAYLKHEWYYKDRPCMGLSLAAILNSAGLSIYEPDWTSSFIDITKDGKEHTARNISTKEHVDIHIPQIRLMEEPELVESVRLVEEKQITLRDDHGKDVLMDFSKRLIRCPYVVGILNSLPFNSHERNFIKKIREEGLIEIVLPWTDKGYGVVVKTTGRNIRETEKIGEIIKERYGHK